MPKHVAGKGLADSGESSFEPSSPLASLTAPERKLALRFARYFAKVIDAAPPSARRVALREVNDARAIDLLLRQANPDVDADPLLAARSRGFEMKERLLEKAGGSLTVMQAAERLGTSRQAVNKAIKAGRLIAYEDKAGHYRLPACQFEDDRILPGLPDVLKALSVEGFWSRLSFLLAEDAMLRSLDPLAALKAGMKEDVLSAARHFGEQTGA